MAGLIDITEALCMAVVRGRQEESLRLTKLAAIIAEETRPKGQLEIGGAA